MTLDGDCAAEPEALTWLDSPAAKGTWQVPETESAADLLRLYRDESSRSDAVAALLSADEAPKYWPPELFGDWRLDSVREVLLHVLVETATHAGHLNAARELIDGKQWIVLDD